MFQENLERAMSALSDITELDAVKQLNHLSSVASLQPLSIGCKS
jgi:hypothetical protein